MKKIKYLLSIVVISLVCIIGLSTVKAVTVPYLVISGPKTVAIGEKIQLKATYTIGNDFSPDPLGPKPDNYEEDHTTKAIWTSSNPLVAIVSSDGQVTGIGEGSVTITAEEPAGETESGTYDFGADAGIYEINVVKRNINSSNVTANITNKIYTGKEQKPSFVLKDGSTVLKSNIEYQILEYINNINVGTATIKIKGIGNYTGEKNITFKINKAKNPMTVKAFNKKVKAKKVKKKKQVIIPITVSKAQGTITYTKVSGNKKIKINKTTGKITIKKKTKKGTYYVKVKVSAAGNKNYNSVSKIIKIKITVK